MTNQNWGFAQVWNESLEQVLKKDLKPRTHLWASELGKSPIDIWLKLKAISYSNEPNARSLRKFEAGNFFEWVVSLILKRAGILKESQRWSSYQYPGLLEVTGKADFIAGGKIDLRMFEQEFLNLGLPDVFQKAGERVINYLLEKYPDGLEEMPLEIKSVSAFMFDAMQKTEKSSKNHRIQVFHYLKSENRPKANLVYICRDDLRLMEFPILNPGPVEEEYKQAIETLSKYALSDTEPPKEEEILFDSDFGKFVKNWNVEYSNYLTKLYGYKEPIMYSEKIKPIVGRWNRVLGRIKSAQKMTPKNQEVLTEIEKAGYNIGEITAKFAGDNSDDEE